MKERPILFKPENVLAILEGRKTQTRRVIKETTEHKGPYNPAYLEAHRDAPGWKQICPHGQPGDRLWVREAWAPVLRNGGVLCRHDRFDLQKDPIEYMRSVTDYVIYKADERDTTKRIQRFGQTTEERWRSPLFMPRWASRITLEITNVRVQRVQEISEEDALAEGISSERVITDIKCFGGPTIEEHGDRFFITDADEGYEDAGSAYVALWDSINLKTHPWSSNPWVWVLEFKKVEV